MARSVLVDSGFLAALLRQRDSHHAWAAAQARICPPPWHSCEAALSETFYVLGAYGAAQLTTLLERDSLRISFSLAEQQAPVLALMQKYRDVPMSLADACLVRMTEIVADPIVLTTDSDFRQYRRHGRQAVPCALPR